MSVLLLHHAILLVDTLNMDCLKDNIENLRSEFFIPLMVNKVISEGTATMRVLSTSAKWFGVTYKEDKPQLMQKIEELITEGVYPRNLWM